MSQAENLKSLPTQRSQKSPSPHKQQTYHVIPATVNQNSYQTNQSYATNKTQTNLSIINRSQNQIPSINHYQKKDHKQNQHHVSLTNSKVDHTKDQNQNQTQHEQKKVNVEQKIKQHSQKEIIPNKVIEQTPIKQLKAHDTQLPLKPEQTKKTQIKQINGGNKEQKNKILHSVVEDSQKENKKQEDHYKISPILQNKSFNHQTITTDQLYWTYLLNLLIQKLDKRKHQQNHHSHKHKQIDLNLQLGSSLISSEKDYENRIKLEFKLFSSHQHKKENTKNIQKTQNVLQNHPVKLSFLLYDLQKNNSPNQTNIQPLKNKLQQLTKHFDKSQFSFTIKKIDKNNEVVQIKQSQQKKKKIKVDFSFSTNFISQQLSIDKHTFEELKNMLLNLPSNHNEVQQSTENNKNHHSLSTSFCELVTSYSLKTIEPIKFLEFLLGGFKLRLFKESHSNNDERQTENITETLYQSLLYLFPEQLYQYIQRVSGGNGKIKFRSIDNLTNLLSRLGIIQMLGETPTVKELLIELIYHFRTLFCVNFQNKLHDKKQVYVVNHNNKLSQLWKIFDTMFHESNSNGLESQLILFDQLEIKLLLECKSHTINHLYNQLIVTN